MKRRLPLSITISLLFYLATLLYSCTSESLPSLLVLQARTSNADCDGPYLVSAVKYDPLHQRYWLATASGLWTYEHGYLQKLDGSCFKYVQHSSHNPTHTIELVGNTIWIGADNAKNGTSALLQADPVLPPKPVLTDPLLASVHFIKYFPLRGVFISANAYVPAADTETAQTETRAFFLPFEMLKGSAPYHLQPVPSVSSKIQDILSAKDSTWWLRTNDGLIFLDAELQTGPLEITEDLNSVRDLDVLGNSVYFITQAAGMDGRLFRITEDRQADEVFPDQGVRATVFGRLRDELVVAVTGARFPILILEPSGYLPYREAPQGLGHHNEPVVAMISHEHIDVIVTLTHVYWRNNGKKWAHFSFSNSLRNVFNIENAAFLGGDLWLWGLGGAFRVDPGVLLAVSFSGEKDDDGRIFFNKDGQFQADIFYSTEDGSPIEVSGATFRFRAAATKAALAESEWQDRSPYFVKDFLDREGTFCYEIRDELGNQREGVQPYLVRPNTDGKEPAREDYIPLLLKYAVPTIVAVISLPMVIVSLAAPVLFLLSNRSTVARKLLAFIAEAKHLGAIPRFLLIFISFKRRLLATYEINMESMPEGQLDLTNISWRDTFFADLSRLLQQPGSAHVLLSGNGYLWKKGILAHLSKYKHARHCHEVLPIFIRCDEFYDDLGVEPDVLKRNLIESAVSQLSNDGDLYRSAIAETALGTGCFVIILEDVPKYQVKFFCKAWYQDRSLSGSNWLIIQVSRVDGEGNAEESSPELNPCTSSSRHVRSK